MLFSLLFSKGHHPEFKFLRRQKTKEFPPVRQLKLNLDFEFIQNRVNVTQQKKI